VIERVDIITRTETTRELLLRSIDLSRITRYTLTNSALPSRYLPN